MLPYTPVQLAGSRLNSVWLVILMFESCKCLIRRNIFICLAAKVLPCNDRFALRRRVCLAPKGLPCNKGFALQQRVCLAAKGLPCGERLPCSERFALQKVCLWKWKFNSRVIKKFTFEANFHFQNEFLLPKWKKLGSWKDMDRATISLLKSPFQISPRKWMPASLASIFTFGLQNKLPH